MPCRGSNTRPTWRCAVSPCTAPCGTQSVVQKSRGIYAKVVTFLSSMTAFHSVLTVETSTSSICDTHESQASHLHLQCWANYSASPVTMLQSLWCGFKVPFSQKCVFLLVPSVVCLSLTVDTVAWSDALRHSLLKHFSLSSYVVIWLLEVSLGICDITNSWESQSWSNIQCTQVWCGHLKPSYIEDGLHSEDRDILCQAVKYSCARLLMRKRVGAIFRILCCN